MMLDDTLLGLLVKNAREMPHDVAMREKRYGVWSPMTWRQMLQKVQQFALGLRAMGFGPGDKLAVIGD
ncbi:MAG: long-chain fatty acid--CoA ligase, partial [Deltaproteobacteria bacterium]|nr:long-chain fatty acid--CoA ligase [Deltaproteobacteria bacterium]